MIYRARVRCGTDVDPAAAGLPAAACAALAHESAPPGDLTLVLVDEAEMRELNRSYAGVDGATDVLSFADGSPDPDTGRVYYGDVFLCTPVAAAQSSRAGHPLEAELTLLAVHGVLHLLGHDHARALDRKRMWAAQAETLETLGFPASSPAGAR